jgi:ribonucleoside-diphosphate reductase alpha chain
MFYDGTVEETHNFAIFTSSKQSDLSEKHLDYSGLFIHNSEYMSIDDSPCNLASLNLMKFTKTSGEFDVERFKSAVKVFITAQDILVSNAGYPNEAIARNAIDFRQLGLGYSNLGALLMSSGLAYDSDEARNLAGSITALMHLEAYNHSSRLAASIGAFSGFEVNRQPMLKVMKQHLDAALSVKPLKNNAHVWEAARRCGEEAIERGNIFGYRNSQVTVLAPVGTIGFLMSCDTTGIEPDIALIKYKTLAGGGALKIVNNSVRSALKSLGYDPETQEKIMKHLEAHDSVEGCPELKEKDLPVFDCAFKPMNGSRSIHYAGHLRMMSAVQPFLSGAISKTNNMPNSSTVEEIMDAYIMAWKLGLKCVAIYRDGSKRSQPLNTKKGGGEKIDDKLVENASKLALENVSLKKEVEALKLQAVDPLRRRLPDTRQAITHKFSVAGHEGYFTVGLFESGLPGELFIQMAKEGSTIGGLMDTIGTLTSMALQYGVPVEALVRKFVNQQFEPSGFTSNPDIKMAKSIIDYVFRWLERQFVEVERPLIPISPTVSVAGKSNGKHSGGFNEQLRSFQLDAPACSGCGHVMVRNGACYRCLSCGESGGCS